MRQYFLPLFCSMAIIMCNVLVTGDVQEMGSVWPSLQFLLLCTTETVGSHGNGSSSTELKQLSNRELFSLQIWARCPSVWPVPLVHWRFGASLELITLSSWSLGTWQHSPGCKEQLIQLLTNDKCKYQRRKVSAVQAILYYHALQVWKTVFPLAEGAALSGTLSPSICTHTHMHTHSHV